jgi:hypothetical protein
MPHLLVTPSGISSTYKKAIFCFLFDTTYPLCCSIHYAVIVRMHSSCKTINSKKQKFITRKQKGAGISLG